MKTNQLTEQLDTLKNIIERWDSCTDIPAIERDIVLEKLRSVYQHIQNPVRADEKAENPLVELELETWEQQGADRDGFQGAHHENRDAEVPQAEEDPTDLKDSSEDCDEEGSDCETSREQTTSTYTAGEGNMGGEEELGSEENVVSQGNMGGDEEFGVEEDIESEGNMGSDEEFGSMDCDDLQAGDAPSDSANTETAPLANEETTRPDQPSEKVGETQELFGQIVSKALVDRFIRDLFWRDERFFVDEVSKLGNQPSFESALIYISEKYNWRADSESAQKFTEILADHNFRE